MEPATDERHAHRRVRGETAPQRAECVVARRLGARV